MIQSKSILVKFIFVFSFCTTKCFGQAFFFQHVDKKQGLYEGIIRSFTQDKFGNMWFGTMSGIYKYNSFEITSFLPDVRDHNSAPAAIMNSLAGDLKGDIWIGTSSGLYIYDHKSSNFRKKFEDLDLSVNELKQINSRYMAILTKTGFYIVDVVKDKILKSTDILPSPLLNLEIFDMVVSKNYFYLTSDTGIIKLNFINKNVEGIIRNPSTLPGFTFIELDRSNVLWASSSNNLGYIYRINLDSDAVHKIKVSDYDQNRILKVVDFFINDLLIDSKDHLWMSTGTDGLIQFDTKHNSFTCFSPTSNSSFSNVSSYSVRRIFEDKENNIWIGTEGHGVNYFNLNQPIFDIKYEDVFPGRINAPVWCRTYMMDSIKNVWLGTGFGIVVINQTSGQPRVIQNSDTGKKYLHSNSIRSMACDQEGNVWIGTSDGVNCYNSKNKNIEFYSQVDSLPNSFYWSILVSRNGRIWFGSRDGLYYKDAGKDGFHSLASIPSLSEYKGWGVHALYEDSHENIWIGLNGNGLIFYNQSADTASLFNVKNSKIVGNAILSIIEDRSGYIWLGTATGLSKFDPSNQNFTSYNHNDGLLAERISGLQVDQRNRIWMASTAGIYVFDSNTKTFFLYNTNNGLPDLVLNEQLSYIVDNNEFLFPAWGGFISFQPNSFVTDTNIFDFYLSGINVNGKPKVMKGPIEEIQDITLKSSENSFEIEMTAINYQNPGESYYAYQMQGIHQEWIYTKNPRVFFLNVAGGKYVFKYKVSRNGHIWSSEKQIIIRVKTVFYKHPLFFIIIFLSLTIGSFYALRSRLRKKSKMLELENISKLFEKEIAVARYENLKQQLNPHLLFNSISSILSLIKIDPAKASDYLESMSKIYRYILKSNQYQSVLIADEVKFTDNYIKLQYFRFENGISIQINLTEDSHNKKIVPVTLQNLIENAIKHNVVDELQPLVIEIYDDGDYLVVQNNLQRKDNVDSSNQQGLNNLILLYKHFSSKPILIEENNKFFRIKIPML